MPSERPGDMPAAHQPVPHEPLAWFVAYTKPGQETVARIHAERQGFETYLPMYRSVKPGATEESAKHNDEPMFPRYLFVRPSRSEQSLSTLRSTRGISTMVSFGNVLATLSDSQLDAIREYEDHNCSELHASSPIQPGRRVRLTAQGLTGLEGLVQAVSSKRVIVLLDLLGRQQSVKVGHDRLELA